MSVAPTSPGDAPVVDQPTEAGHSPTLLVGEGALGMVSGVLALTWPGPTAVVLAWLIGVHLLAVGVLRLLAAASDRTRTGVRGISGGLGTLSVLVGILCLRAPLQTLLALGLLIGVAWVVGGVVRVVQGVLADHGTPRTWPIAAGLLSVVAGGVVLLYPDASLVAFTSIIGVVLVLEGACLIAAGLTIRRAQADARAAAGPGRVPRPAVPPPVRL
jgi:uncharacterized membrane protein HdeD (DUF308 family)